MKSERTVREDKEIKSEWTVREDKDQYIDPDDMGFSGKEGIDDGETEDNGLFDK